MDPNDLRSCVENAIIELIEPVAWERCTAVNAAEQEFVAHDPAKLERRAMSPVVHFPRPYREPPPSEPDQLELWPDLPPPPVRDTRQTLLAEIEEAFAQISAHVDAVRIAFALLDEAEL